ncbi:MAG TPA: NrfD/PsrC family molybdoenzyme membrane anchor subunit [Candidatus Limnocylindria bacterium]|nr:NrfD/PsrC family molybdoenzyme membrane anchor subunit [Candidatus Limnocylindria bacterium]
MTGAEHFALPPSWEWWILGYFFLGGLAGGSYAIGTLLRIAGGVADQTAARIAYVASFLALVPCPIFLTLDLGQPLRFYHMLFDTSEGGLAFKYWSPMSVGAWALLVFGLFSFVSFLAAIAELRWVRWTVTDRIAAGLSRGAGIVWGVVGTVFGLFIAGYTGVLLAVSNQAVWSDAGWVLGGMFLASALSGSAAMLLLLARSRRDVAAGTALRIEMADRNFVILEAVLIVLFLASVAVAGTITRMLGVWLVLWLVVLVGLAAPFLAMRTRALATSPAIAPILALLGVLALRAVVIFAPQL